MTRKEYLSRISVALSRFTSEVEILAGNNEYDVNIHAEDVLIPVLNTVYGINLVNANRVSKNFPALDLIDTENRIGFQITSTDSTTKNKSTLEKLRDNGLIESFDSVHIYVLKSGELKGKIPDEYKDLVDDISLLNHTKFYDVVKGLPTPKIGKVSNILHSEFSDIKIQVRKSKQSFDIEEKDTVESVFTNFINLTIPQKIRSYEFSLTDKQMIQFLGWKRKERGNITKRKLINKFVKRKFEINYFPLDWLDFENRLLTFEELDENHYLSEIVDLSSYYEIDVLQLHHSNNWPVIFLLKQILIDRLPDVDLEYSYEENVVRFSAGEITAEKKISWDSGKKVQPRAVIHEIWSKDPDKKHIVCFRHQAFIPSFFEANGKFYMNIVPTYSFTSNGMRKSRFSKHYMSGIKRMETNQTLYYHIRFWEYYLKKLNKSESLIETNDWPYVFDFGDLEKFEVSPAIEDSKWNLKEETFRKPKTKKIDPFQTSLFDED